MCSICNLFKVILNPPGRIKVKHFLFAFFILRCSLPVPYFSCAKTAVKKPKKLSCQISDFSKLLLLWMSQKSTPPSAHLTWSIKNYNWNWLHQNTCVIQHDLPFSSLFISKSLILSQTFQLPQCSIPHQHLTSLSSTLNMGKTGYISQLQKTPQMFDKLAMWKVYPNFC